MPPRSPPTAGDSRKKITAVEVHVYRDGAPILRKVIKRSPASIGRDPQSDIRLESARVSRTHAELMFNERELRVVDAGSQNGIKLRGQRQEEIRPGTDDVIELCEFELHFRPRMSQAATWQAELSQGWAELVETDDDPDTAVRPRPQPPAQSMSMAATLSDESAGSSVAQPAEEIDEEEAEELRDPDLPSVLETMSDEAAELLVDVPGATVAVEVIKVVGDTVYDVELLLPGRSSWWGAAPRPWAALWDGVTTQQFPMVTHLEEGRYRICIPDDSRWRMYHRGQEPVTSFRAGALVGCQAGLREQIEITCGAFKYLVRCVRAHRRLRGAPPRRGAMEWRLGLAFVLSAVLHASAMAIPMAELPILKNRRAAPSSYVLVTMPPQPTEEEPAPELAALPAMPPAPRQRVRQRRAKPGATAATRETRRQASTGWEPTRPTPPPEPLATVSVADFRVAGLIAHLPTVELDGADSTLRGGSSILRGEGVAGRGILSKNAGAMGLSPKGRLPRGAVRNVVNRNAAKIETCYNRSLAGEPELSGRVEVEWIVNRNGTVGTVRVIYDEVGSESLSRCIRQTISKWLFVSPKGGAARVSFPFMFLPLRGR